MSQGDSAGLGEAVEQLKRESSRGLYVGGVKLPLALTDTLVLEGYLGMLDYITRPYESPYRIMIPQRIDGVATIAAEGARIRAIRPPFSWRRNFV